MCGSLIFFGLFQKTTLVPCPPNWAKAQCSERRARGWVGPQQVERLGPACPSALHLSKHPCCRMPVSHRRAVLGWGGRSILGTWTSFGFFFFFPSFCLPSWKRSVKGGQHMGCMVKQNCWRAGHKICLLLLLMSLFNYLCSKWIKRC